MKGGWIRQIVYRMIDSTLVHDRNEIKVALMCVVVSAMLWFLNALNSNYISQIVYPVSFQYDSVRYRLESPAPKYLKLNIYGQGWKILRHNLKVGPKPILCKIPQGQILSPAFLLPIAGKSISDFKVQAVLDDTIKIKLREITVVKN